MFSLTTLPIWAATTLYGMQALLYFRDDHPAQALCMLEGYIIANVGLIWSAA